MYFSYILQLKNGEYYSGYTDDLKKRFADHTAGKVHTTKEYRPLKLVWYGAFTSKQKALAFEKYLKSSSGFAFRNKRFL